ncbi:protein Pat-like [Oncorhynchus keta]|uniref:protein Pat-like n=1 Tax=Oncorhynchus keta TaxID=8018 RepID=UPI0015F99BEC|nr:protein Pat-like [Oncorhynchus keta]
MKLLASQHNINIALITVRRQLKKLGWIYKNKARFDPMEKRMVTKKAAMIDGGPAQYHSAQLMKLHMEQIQTLKTDIESLKVDQQKEKHSLRAEIRATADALVQSQVALTECQAALVESRTENGSLKRAREEMESQFMPIHVSSGTPLPTGSSSVHPDISIPRLTPERNELLTEHSMGRPDRYAVVLFQECVTKERYREWAQNTNWDGSRGKLGLPVNLRVFIMKNVSQMFLSLSDATRKSIRVNEYLRKPRKSGYGMARFP